jgi:hypothetical protein
MATVAPNRPTAQATTTPPRRRLNPARTRASILRDSLQSVGVGVQSNASRLPPARRPAGRPATAAAAPLWSSSAVAAPTTWPTMAPSRPRKKVSGTPSTPHRRAVSPEPSSSCGNERPREWTTSRACRADCALPTPSIKRPWPASRAARSSRDASCRHGAQGPVQKLMMTGVPRSSVSDTRPSRATRHQRRGAAPRSPAVSTPTSKAGAGAGRPRETASCIASPGASVTTRSTMTARRDAARTASEKRAHIVGRRRRHDVPLEASAITAAPRD